jgi:ribosomal protein L34
VRTLTVDIARPPDGGLALTYEVTGRIAELRLPPPATPARADDLWRTTCFEAFLRAQDSDAYLELNFAPSGAWATYRFSGYRAGMSQASGRALIETRATADRFELRARAELGDFPLAKLALSAVIEETSGVKSYWALAHPQGKPDFHHSAGFVLDLTAPERP